MPAVRNKYHAIKTEVDGITFDSKKEAKRYAELKLMERAGKIRNLELQKEFLLSAAYRKPDGKAVRKCSYFADFAYEQWDDKTSAWETVVEDVKGYRAPQSAAYSAFKVKAKWVHDKYGVDILET